MTSQDAIASRAAVDWVRGTELLQILALDQVVSYLSGLAQASYLKRSPCQAHHPVSRISRCCSPRASWTRLPVPRRSTGKRGSVSDERSARRDGCRTNVGCRRQWPSPNFLHPKSDGPHFGFRKKWRRSGRSNSVRWVASKSNRCLFNALNKVSISQRHLSSPRMVVTREASGLRMMRDSPLINRVPVTESFWPQTTRCPLNWMTSPRAKLRKKLQARCRTIPAPSDACVVLNANPRFYFIFSGIANKFRTDEFSIGETVTKIIILNQRIAVLSCTISTIKNSRPPIVMVR